MLLWQDELNPRVRCAFGNVFSTTQKIMRLTVGVLVAIVVGLEKPTLLAQSDIYIPKCTEGGTVGENRNFWLLKTSLIFQVISWGLDVNLSRVFQ